MMPATTRKFSSFFQVTPFGNRSECCSFRVSTMRSAAPSLRPFRIFSNVFIGSAASFVSTSCGVTVESRVRLCERKMPSDEMNV